MPRWGLSLGLLVVSGCGVPTVPSSDATVATETTVGTETTVVVPSTQPAVQQWLMPAGDLPGFRLVGAVQAQVADCGPTADCALTVASATLQYDTDDLAARRSLSIVQTAPRHDALPPDPVQIAEVRIAGERQVHVVEALPYIQAGWTEPNGDTVRVDSLGLPWGELAGIIGDLRPIDAIEWPGVEVQSPLGRCVDARSQLAPPVPAGWQRFVLQAQPTGSCGVFPFLMMSLVMPGTLVTIVISPASESTPQPGEPVVIDGRTGTLQESTLADGEPTSGINIVIDTVAVDAHGIVDAAQLQAIVESIRPFDDSEWADLVSSVATPP